jgi:hypothetical protein
MNEELNIIEIYNGITEQQTERRKRKKRRGKISNESGETETENIEEPNPQGETPLVTLDALITGESNKLPIDYNQNPNPNPYPVYESNGEKLEQESTKKKKRKKRGRREKEKEEENEVNEVKEENEVNEKPQEIDENERKALRTNLNNQFKRTENINKSKKRIKDKDDKGDGIIPSKDINPKELYENDDDEEDELDELDYLKAQKAYELSVFLDSHKFIKNNKNFDLKFNDLVKRKLIRFERNMYDLVDNDQFFILYELQVSEHTNLTLNDMITLNAIKSILNSFPSNHLIIIISDEELYNKSADKYDFSLIEDFGREKLKNILLFFNSDNENENRIHAFSTIAFKRINSEFENQKNYLKQLVDKPRLRKLFNLTDKEDERNDSLLDYPCYLAVAANPSLYTNFIPDINADYKCLIINSIFYMNRYLMCFDAANALNFNDPSAIALKLVPHLNGFNDLENYGDYNEDNVILSSDDTFSLNKKMQMLDNESNERNPNLDVACQYLGFLDEDNKNYQDMTKQFEKGNIDKREIINRVYDLLQDLLKVFKEKYNNDIDIDKIMIK